jgi:hypothetical protein
MYSKLLVLILLSACTASAQLAITPGAQFSIAGNIQLTLNNTGFINNGTFTAGNGTASFTGNASSAIAGSQPIQFNELEINKSSNSSVLLQKAISVRQRILFVAGFLNLNGFNADLGTSGRLDGEQENTRIIGPDGGEILFNVSLNSPVSSNPGNLGAVISSSQNLGSVTVRRGHQAQLSVFGSGNGMLRYYDITAANNTNINASLRFIYLDGELNNLNENSMELFQSQPPGNWTRLGSSSRDIVANFIEKTGINSFGRFTLAEPGNILAVHFTLFNATCREKKVLLTWQTAQEQNSRSFNIERSSGGISWTVIGNVRAAGNSSTESNYSFTDNNPLQNGFYRIVEHDLNGAIQYTSTRNTSCNMTDVFRIWPNPVQDEVFVNIVTTNLSQATLKLFDSKGALVKIQWAMVLPGTNSLRMSMKPMAAGVYVLSVNWENGQMKKAERLLKQ